MSLRRIIALATRIIRQVLRDRRTLALIFVVPIVIMTLLYLVLSSNSSTRTLALVRPTGVASENANMLIDKLLPGGSQLKVISIHANQVNATLKNGDADAALIFPPDFVQQMLAGTHPLVQTVLEGSDPNVASA
ncbi:MAG: ABC transporter permease, partial [Ktedonobacteraceae bacterium]|nr:ABC transporter permease [Ktedonobacteraceae bacterium]